MEAKKKRLTLYLESTLRRRTRSNAAAKGISMRWYRQPANDHQGLTGNEANGMAGLLSDKPDRGLLQRSGGRYLRANLVAPE